MKEKLMPPLVLTIICVVVSGLLALAYNVTYVDLTGVMTDELKTGCKNIFGEAEYEMLTEEKDGKKAPVNFGNKNINSIIVDRNASNCIIEITEDGYSKGGLHLLVGLDSDGKVQGIEFVSIGETPGLGTKVQDKSFTKKFLKADAETDIDGIDNVTAATFSSKGMKKAVRECLDIFSKNKEAIFGD